MDCQICCRKGLVGLTTSGRCHNYCGVNMPERTTMGCTEMSGHCLHVIFIYFGGEMKH
jgi:hypothetical protein